MQESNDSLHVWKAEFQTKKEDTNSLYTELMWITVYNWTHIL